MQCVSGTFISSAGPVNVDCGFIPDYVEAYSALGGTELGWKWYRPLADAATSGQYGISIGADGAIGVNSSGSGITAYDTAAIKALLPAPNGNGTSLATIYGTFAAAKVATLTPTARTVAVLGTVIRPTVANGYLYECTASGGAMTSLTEPTWPTVVGDTVSDGSNTWRCREENLQHVGVKGFTVEAGIASDGEIWVFKAERHDRSADFGDADAGDPIKATA